MQSATWASPSFARLYLPNFPNWPHEPEVLVRADQLPDDAVWLAHQEAKRDLLAKVQEIAGVQLDPERPLIGFARRMTGYKRPDLLFSDCSA